MGHYKGPIHPHGSSDLGRQGDTVEKSCIYKMETRKFFTKQPQRLFCTSSSGSRTVIDGNSEPGKQPIEVGGVSAGHVSPVGASSHPPGPEHADQAVDLYQRSGPGAFSMRQEGGPRGLDMRLHSKVELVEPRTEDPLLSPKLRGA